MKKRLKGISVDIDETLAWTVGYWVFWMQKLFGNPEELSVKALVAKYKYTQNVPYWQSREALEWMESQRNDNSIQMKLPLIKGSNTALNKINKIIPITAYITTRPEDVIDGTKKWLSSHGFPPAEVICRPKGVKTKDGNKWKARILTERSDIMGIIDDNPDLLAYLKGYKGSVFLLGTVNPVPPGVFPCKDLEEVYKKISKTFKQN